MSSGPAASQMFEALANPYRRQLLLALFEAGPQDHDIGPLDVLQPGEMADDRDAIRIKLHHSHLPKLDEMGFIEWDRESEHLSKGPNWESIAPLLRLLCDHRDELPVQLSPGAASSD